MSSAASPRGWNRIPKPLIFSVGLLLILGAIPIPGHAQLWNGVISSARATDWTKAGISGYSSAGTLPSDMWTQCGATIAAYGTSGSPASTATITNALKHTATGYTSCGANTYVLLGAGDFYLTGYIGLTGMQGDELRGSGPTQTRLHWGDGSGCPSGSGNGLICVESSDTTYPTSSTTGPNWTAGYTQGATSITLSNTTSITANSTLIILDQDDDGYTGLAPTSGTATDNGNFFNCGDAYNPTGPVGCSFNASFANAARPHRLQQEIVQATACSPSCGGSGSTTVTISAPLANPNWASARTPAAWIIQPSQFIGVRNLTLDCSSCSYSGTVFGIEFYNVANFWARNVVLKSFPNTSMFIKQAAYGDISDNYIYNSGQSSATNDSSGINWSASHMVIANNICHNCHLAIMQNNPGVGNVIAYNYLVNAYTGNATMFGTLWTGHSNGTNYNLYEANVADGDQEDQTHGAHLMNTFYRNFFTGWESCGNASANCGGQAKKTDLLFAFSPLSFNRYGNVVANVAGTPGVSTVGYAYQNASYYLSNGSGLGYIYNLGSGNASSPTNGGTAGGPIPLDSVVASSIYRWGNWDAYNAATQWNTAEVPSGISAYPQSVPTASCTSSLSCPASLYYSSRPAWYASSIPFPVIGPDVTGGNVGQCSGTLNASGKYAGLPGTSSSQCGSGNTVGTAWGGHVNAIPAMAYYLTLGGNLDGTSTQLTSFDANVGYAAAAPPAIPTGMNPAGRVMQ